MQQRTVYCGEVSTSDIGKQVILNGWVQRRRDQGGLIFVDLRDRTGIVQTVVDAGSVPEAHDVAESVRGEYVLEIIGEVRRRPAGTENANITTGDVEVAVEEGSTQVRVGTALFGPRPPRP